MPTYNERLTAPASWWVCALAFAVVWGWIMLVVTTWPIAIATTVIVAALTLAGVWRYGSLRIETDGHELRVGAARIVLSDIGTAIPLDRAEYRRRLGTGADARAHLVTRPYLDHGVLIEITDDRDPTPYWLVSSRRPQALAAAVNDNEVAAPRRVVPDPSGEGSRGEEE